MISRHGNMIQPHVTSLIIHRECVSHIERANECEKEKRKGKEERNFVTSRTLGKKYRSVDRKITRIKN